MRSWRVSNAELYRRALQSLALRVSKLYERNIREFMDERRIIIYGSYLEHEEGIYLLEYLRDKLREDGFRHVYLVKDLSDEELGLQPLENVTENIKNLLRSIQSFTIADVLVFIFSNALTKHLAGVVVELSMYAAMLSYGDVPSSYYALVLVSENIEERISSLIKGILEHYEIPNKTYTTKNEAYEAIISHIHDIIFKEKQELIFKFK